MVRQPKYGSVEGSTVLISKIMFKRIQVVRRIRDGLDEMSSRTFDSSA